jgi:hypothetical protein
MTKAKKNIAASVAARLLPAEPCSYPALLEFPPPEILAYPREMAVAEKLEALVVLGDRNSRIKDFFDLRHLANRFEFDRATLVESARRTFERRHIVEGKTVCLVSCQRSPEPVFLRWKGIEKSERASRARAPASASW